MLAEAVTFSVIPATLLLVFQRFFVASLRTSGRGDDTGRRDIVVVGSANVDLIIRLARLPGPGETVTGGELARAMGGKGANAAVAAARLGARVTLIAALGDDADGAAVHFHRGARAAGSGGRAAR